MSEEEYIGLTPEEEWNAQADEYNQWDSLGQDEKEHWIAHCNDNECKKKYI